MLLVPSFEAASQPAPPLLGPGNLCLTAIEAAERGSGIPAQLLRSIALVESGRVDPISGRRVPWPWTINAAGAGYYFENKDEAIAAVRRFQASGIRSIDVGCAQVNLQHHPTAFPSLDAAFDPQINVTYAARFLNALYQTTGSWPGAAAGYHSMARGIGSAYAERVLAIWPGRSQYGVLPAASRGPNPVGDYSNLTPAFARIARRIDEDRALQTRTVALRAPVWINRPPAPIPVLPPGSRRFAQRGQQVRPG
ncbi:transglycosylase SLT domain-containing protein [Muricoccus radiodurans]|uniref:transglycosylase SLT domain-containing protein n=1 Tax=Muricoccus radiodurans TaxID=2231721 RepID=UPI003CEA66DF